MIGLRAAVVSIGLACGGVRAGGPLWAIHYCLRDFRPVDAATFRPGERHRLAIDLWGPHGERELKSLTLNVLGGGKELVEAPWFMVLRWHPEE